MQGLMWRDRAESQLRVLLLFLLVNGANGTQMAGCVGSDSGVKLVSRNPRRIENRVLLFFMPKGWGHSQVYCWISLQQGSYNCSWCSQASFPWLLCSGSSSSSSMLAYINWSWTFSWLIWIGLRWFGTDNWGFFWEKCIAQPRIKRIRCDRRRQNSTGGLVPRGGIMCWHTSTSCSRCCRLGKLLFIVYIYNINPSEVYLVVNKGVSQLILFQNMFRVMVQVGQCPQEDEMGGSLHPRKPQTYLLLLILLLSKDGSLLPKASTIMTL